jgi:zinc transporter 9
MSKPIGQKSVITALIGNAIVAIFKVVAYLFSGSSVILSEAVHSFADTSNQFFLLIGIKRAEKPADDSFNYGYKGERFFWSLLSACGVFFLGAGATIYHGLSGILHPEISEFNYWTIALLVVSFFFEGYALITATRELRNLAGKQNILKYFKESADPTLLAIIFEDSAAITGIVIAIITTFITRFTGNPIWDSVGSIVIGALLGLVAISLMNLNRELLIGRAIPTQIRKRIFTILLNKPVVEEVHDFKTVMITTDGYRVKAEIEINGHYLADKIFDSRDFKREYEEIEDYEDFLRFCVSFSDEVTRTLGKEIDELENDIEKEVPTVTHIDIEAN